MVSNSRKYYGEVKRDVEEFLSPNGRADENCPFVPIAGEMNLAEYVYAMSRSIIAYEDSQYNIDFRFNAIVSNSSL